MHVASDRSENEARAHAFVERDAEEVYSEKPLPTQLFSTPSPSHHNSHYVHELDHLSFEDLSGHGSIRFFTYVSSSLRRTSRHKQ